MKLLCQSASIAMIFCAFGCAATPEQQTRITQSFDANWRFQKSETKGAERSEFDDANWVQKNVPDDAMIAGPFDQHNPAGGAGAFLPSGVVWYRKHFELPATVSSRKFFIEFDGVMANSDVWINGFLLGHRPNGYVGFRYNLTPHLKFGPGTTNILAVRADTSAQPASRWYAGTGIYRHVRLIESDPVHFADWGTFVTTPKVAKEQSKVHIHNSVVNQSAKPAEIIVRVTLIDPQGKALPVSESKVQNIPAGGSAAFEQDIEVQPQLWDLDHPNLYTANCDVRAAGTTLDNEATPFGIRDAEFRADTGFWLNGESIKLKGVCLHGDAGGLGVAVPLAAWEHRLSALKQLGANAIRTAHNPPSPEFLDLCDRMGFLVMDEMFDCWTVAKNPFDYHVYFKDWSVIDTRDTVQRDRNHPSVILYSAGNEIHDTPNASISIPILKSLVATFHEYDPTRAVTQALFRPNVSHDYTNGLADLLDVVGTNYRDTELLAAHAAKPTRKILGTENGPGLPGWLLVRDNPQYAGYFLWTGADYLGESRRWPTVQHDSGLIDITDEPRGIGYQRQSWWTTDPMVQIVRDEGSVATGNIPGEPQRRVIQYCDWSPQNSNAHPERVLVFSNCDEVELFLNGNSLGSKDRPKDDSPRTWRVAYEPGEIKAVAKNSGKVVTTQVLRTAGKPTKIVLSVDRDSLVNCWDDVAYVTAVEVDENGTVNPAAGDLISFKITGPGAIAAVESTDAASHESFISDQRHAFRGRCVAIVRANRKSGEFEVRAAAQGLSGGSVKVRAIDGDGSQSK